MQLVHTGSRYEAVSSYNERHLPKAAGFRWDKDAKIWWTDKREAAAKLADYATDEIKEELAKADQQRRDTVALSRATSLDVELPVPEGLEYLPFQRAGIAFATSRKATLIGDDMGLGKTVQGIGTINVMVSEHLAAGSRLQDFRVLIICPASLRLNWYRELKKWLTDPLQIAIASTKHSFPSGFNVVIINYDILTKFDLSLRRLTWDLLIADEAHYMKNPDTKRTALVVGKRKKGAPKEWEIEPLNAKRSIFLTGTPMPNRAKELWPIIHYLDPETWNNQFAFARRYCNASQTRWGWDMSGASNLEELQERLRSTIMVRRLKADVLTELPPKRRQVVEIPAGDAEIAVREEVDAYREHEEKMQQLRACVELAKASDDPAEYAAAVSRLKDAASVAFTEMSQLRHKTALAKVPFVVEHLRDCLEGGKVLVFAHHIDVIDAIMAEFPDAVRIDGRMNMADRQASVDRFQKDDSVRLFVGGIHAAGVGLTLTASSHVVFAELDWVPGNVTQAEDRTHRIGQRNSVLVQHLVLEGSLDAKMARTLVRKQEDIEKALDRVTAEVELSVPLVATEDVREERPVTTSREKIAKEALEITPEMVEAIHYALQVIAGRCDGARQMDGNGFNKMDSYIGKELAYSSRLSPKQAALGRKIANKYKRQLGPEVTARMFGAAVADETAVA